MASLQYAAQQFEQPLTDDAAKSIIGLGLPEVMQILFPGFRFAARYFAMLYGIIMLQIQKGDHGLVVWQSCWLT